MAILIGYHEVCHGETYSIGKLSKSTYAHVPHATVKWTKPVRRTRSLKNFGIVKASHVLNVHTLPLLVD